MNYGMFSSALTRTHSQNVRIRTTDSQNKPLVYDTHAIYHKKKNKHTHSGVTGKRTTGELRTAHLVK